MNALKENNPQFAAMYDRQYWDLKQGKLGEENASAACMIDESKRELHKAAHGG